MSEESTPPPAAATPAPTRKTGLWEGSYDRIVAPVRRWLKADDSDQIGFLFRRTKVKREKHKQMRLLFVDVANANRSQMAQVYGLIAGFHAESAGTFPALRIPQETLHVMKEQGLDLDGFRPKPLDVRRLGAFDRVIVFSNALPRHLAAGTVVEHWNTVDPQGLTVEAFRDARRDIERRIRVLARAHGVRPVEQGDVAPAPFDPATESGETVSDTNGPALA
ncbi:MAG: hypothetical protein AABX89_04200 [Candidatus Thermoplasmatota archaeon]